MFQATFSCKEVINNGYTDLIFRTNLESYLKYVAGSLCAKRGGKALLRN